MIVKATYRRTINTGNYSSLVVELGAEETVRVDIGHLATDQLASLASKLYKALEAEAQKLADERQPQAGLPFK